MADAAGTPLWLTLVLQAATLFGTHLLTSRREKSKRRDDVLKDWRKEQIDLLKDCVDSAIDHYVNPSAVPGTSVSAQRILDKLRRFRVDLTKFDSKDGHSRGQAAVLYMQLHEKITDKQDFLDCKRVVREPDDELFDAIRGCEDALITNIRKERVVR